MAEARLHKALPASVSATRGDGGEAARRKAMQSASRNSSRVRRLKVILPIIGVIALTGIGAATVLARLGPSFDIASVLLSKDGLTMVEPHLSGRANDRAYEVTAARATQSLANPKIMHLDRIDARIEMSDASWAKVVAKTGVYDGDKQTLKLQEGITVVTQSGVHIALDAADINLDSGMMTSESRLTVDSPTATIQSGGIVVSDNGTAVLFTNGVTMTVHPSDGASAAGAGPASGSQADAAPPAPVAATTTR